MKQHPLEECTSVLERIKSEFVTDDVVINSKADLSKQGADKALCYNAVNTDMGMVL